MITYQTGVQKLIAGTNTTISPTTGVGNVTVNAQPISAFVTPAATSIQDSRGGGTPGVAQFKAQQITAFLSTLSLPTAVVVTTQAGATSLITNPGINLLGLGPTLSSSNFGTYVYWISGLSYVGSVQMTTNGSGVTTVTFYPDQALGTFGGSAVNVTIQPGVYTMYPLISGF